MLAGPWRRILIQRDSWDYDLARFHGNSYYNQQIMCRDTFKWELTQIQLQLVLSRQARSSRNKKNFTRYTRIKPSFPNLEDIARFVCETNASLWKYSCSLFFHNKWNFNS